MERQIHSASWFAELCEGGRHWPEGAPGGGAWRQGRQAEKIRATPETTGFDSRPSIFSSGVRYRLSRLACAHAAAPACCPTQCRSRKSHESHVNGCFWPLRRQARQPTGQPLASDAGARWRSSGADGRHFPRAREDSQGRRSSRPPGSRRHGRGVRRRPVRHRLQAAASGTCGGHQPSQVAPISAPVSTRP
jgi:hypothetical protein